MILVNGEPVGDAASVGLKKNSVNLENLLPTLLEHPVLLDSANALKAAPVQVLKPPYPSGNSDINGHADQDGVDCSADPKFIYVFQQEFATVHPEFAQFIGTDEMTTCIGVVLRDPSSGLTSVGHFDTADVVIPGLNQLVTSVGSIGNNGVLQVHLVGAFDDSLDHDDDGSRLGDLHQKPGCSWPLALRMIEALQESSQSFELETCCILQQNTKIGPGDHSLPIVRGLVAETSSGRLRPARFEPDARGPDGTVRKVCLFTRIPDTPSLLSPYDRISDLFVINRFTWTGDFGIWASDMLNDDDAQFLQRMSTSPYAESADFLPELRRTLSYLCNNPDWKQTFGDSSARVFKRASHGGWTRIQPSNF